MREQRSIKRGDKQQGAKMLIEGAPYDRIPTLCDSLRNIYPFVKTMVIVRMGIATLLSPTGLPE